MPKPVTALLPSEPDPTILARFYRVERVCLAALVVIAVANVIWRLTPGLGPILPNGWQPMKAESLAAILLSALCLMYSEAGQTRWKLRLSVVLAAAVMVLAAAVLFKYRPHMAPVTAIPLLYSRGFAMAGGMTLQTAGGFELLGCAMILMRAQGRFSAPLADVLTLCVCASTLTLVSGHIIGTLSIFGVPGNVPTSPQTMLCLMLLTAVTVLRRAEVGVFSIFAGSGIGGRLARFLCPFLLILPFLREGARAHLLGEGRMPAHYVTAVLASMAAVVSMALLLFLAWQIKGMETEIHSLSLSDELTKLYNLKGFRLLAGQALRLAHRAHVPFSVLFIDLDNLKQINDSMGHTVGSVYLTETAEILGATFRETDVLGRIGGDEFAVAGQFSEEAISVAIQRLEEACAKRNAEAGRRFPLSFSVGHVTTVDEHKETLDELLAKADQVMYEAKRIKKEGQSRGERILPDEAQGVEPT